MPTHLGKKINQLRKEKKWTLEKLAEQTDSSKSYIWELENKSTPRPSAEKIDKIAKALGVTTEFLLDNANRSPDENVIDQAFFRNYQELPPATKTKIRELVKVWSNKE